MIEWLDNIDKTLMLFLNGFNSPFMDTVMAFITNKKTWFPAYALLAIYLIYKYKLRGLYYVILILLTIAACDQITSSFLKPFVGRLRPCHQDGFSTLIHREGHCGGLYSFVSGHAANSFALATSVYLLILRGKKWGWTLFVWAAVVAYSRVYVGVHFPADIVVGMLIGVITGYLLFNLWIRLNNKYRLTND